MAVRADNVDQYLDTLLATWGEMVDEYIADWPQFDEEQRAIIIADFGSDTARQADLDEYVRTHELTPAQAAKYRRLRELIGSKHARLTEMGFMLWPLIKPVEQAA